jgi:ferric iron reductase protein FhuF
MKDTLLDSKLSTSLIETFIDKKVKEELKREILFALSSFFSQTYRVLFISTSKQFVNSGS